MTTTASVAPIPFEVAIPQEDVDDLVARLRRTRWPDDPGNDDWDYGTNAAWLRELVGYWADGFDWRHQERQINQLPQFRVDIDGVPIHYVHVRGVGPNPMPVVLTHGWPWTFWDWKDVIGPLADPAAHGGDPADAFDVVVPSLPGHGFSVPLARTGIGARQVAGLWHRLMTEVLGHERYGAGGGDWGSIVTGELGHGFPDHVMGAWLTMPYVPGAQPHAMTEQDFAPDESWMWERVRQVRPLIRSHSTVHQVEPQTIAYALADSPAGLAAWTWQRRHDWGDHDGNVLDAFDRDFLCTTASIQWFNASIASSLRIYREHFRDGRPPAPLHDRPRTVEVPTGISVFPKELVMLPRAKAAELTNLVRWEVLPKGGHFAPAEVPDLVVDEVREFFRLVR